MFAPVFEAFDFPQTCGSPPRDCLCAPFFLAVPLLSYIQLVYRRPNQQSFPSQDFNLIPSWLWVISILIRNLRLRVAYLCRRRWSEYGPRLLSMLPDPSCLNLRKNYFALT